jgi:hypothetical protein
VKDGVRKALRDRQLALTEPVHAIREYRTIAESKPLTLHGSDYAFRFSDAVRGYCRERVHFHRQVWVWIAGRVPESGNDAWRSRY